MARTIPITVAALGRWLDETVLDHRGVRYRRPVGGEGAVGKAVLAVEVAAPRRNRMPPHCLTGLTHEQRYKSVLACLRFGRVSRLRIISSRPGIVRLRPLFDQYRKSARRISAAGGEADVDHNALDRRL